MSRERVELTAPARAVRLLAHGAEAVRALELEQAFATGHAAGRDEAGAVLDVAVARLATLEEESRGALARAAVELGLAIAKKLLRREIAQGHYDIERIVRETLHEAAIGRSPCVVHLHPADHATLAAIRFRSGTKIALDEGVPRADVHVETALGLLVRDVDGALEAIERRLAEELA
ncbi:MAG: hypothetical protein EXS08_11380 [Planctomycetes bacterium]|nr:hypothetical protein [Planctomycetota bacterium]